jgi:hypothetical protein
MNNAQITAGIYTCLEMLRLSGREDLVQYWCNFLYTEDGSCWLPSWTEDKLHVMENDVIHYA